MIFLYTLFKIFSLGNFADWWPPGGKITLAVSWSLVANVSTCCNPAQVEGKASEKKTWSGTPIGSLSVSSLDY